MSLLTRLIAGLSLCCAAGAFARGDDALGVARPVVVPHVGVLQRSAKPPLSLQRVTAKIDVRGETVTTQLDVQLNVTGKSSVVCDVLVPLPQKAELISVLPGRDGSSKANADFASLSGTAAKSLLRQLAVNLNDAAVLEFYGSNIVLVRSLSFPGGDKPVVQIRYREAAKPTTGYVVPRSERLHYATPWSISAVVQPSMPDAWFYCPSHPLEAKRATDGSLFAKVKGNATAEPGPFRLTWTTGTAGVNGFVLTYPPQQKEDGYFLWMLQAPESKPEAQAKEPKPVAQAKSGVSHPSLARRASMVKREITLVIDRSASMDGERIRQVRAVSHGVLGKLRAGESFNIVTYNQTVDAYAKQPVGNTATNVAAATTYLKDIRPQGGSNIYDALKTSLAQPAAKGRLPIVLFFTDGLPTSGSPSEVKIRNLALKDNPHGRRIYTVGIGVDLLSPLLNSLATASGGRAVFVLPKEDVEKKLAPTLARLQDPIFTDVKLDFRTADGKDAAATFQHVIPSRVPDLFAGDQVVVLGRYRGTTPRTLTVAGNYLGTDRSFRFSLDPKTASTSHTFLPRLWASRRIGQLVEAIRQDGAKAPAPYAVRTQTPGVKLERRSKEVLELTARYGVLTEYTAFLSQRADAKLGPFSQLVTNFSSRAVRTRSGYGAVNQDTNNTIQNAQVRLNGRNRYWNAQMNCEDVGTVQQIGTLALFRRGNRWIDGRLLLQDPRDFMKSRGSAGTTVAFGSSAYWKLLDKLSSKHLQGVLAVGGDVLLLRDGKPLLVTGPTTRKRDLSPAANLKVK